MGHYIPSTQSQREEMLEVLGLNTLEELFSPLDSGMLLDSLNIPEGKNELALSAHIEALASENTVYKHIFRGAGAYHHYIPSVVKRMAAKEEFVTAYTPYQAEMSQGILQAIFEYQTMICMLTDMDVSNASVYDGATAAAEAVAMTRERKRSTVLLSGAVHPDTIETIKTYCWANGMQCNLIPTKDGKTDLDALKSALNGEVASVLVQEPNYFGLFEDCDAVVSLAHEVGAKCIMSVNPIATVLRKTPGELGADIAVGEGQPLGIPLSFGGPYLGFMATTSAMARKLPGRIVGETVDHDERRAFVLTLQAREQHIRREKASSNICSNQALCALTAAIYMGTMGKSGMREVAKQCYDNAHYLAEELTKLDGFSLVYEGDFFHEFVCSSPVGSNILLNKLSEKGILGGLAVDGGILWCATEMANKDSMDGLILTIKEVLGL